MTDYGKLHREYDKDGNANHYKKGGIENYDILVAKLTPEELRGFLKGSIINYILRDFSQENDTVKAAWYSEKLKQMDSK